MTDKPEVINLENTLTVSQVAKICRVSGVTVTRWIKAGRLVAIRPPSGRPFYIKEVDFLAFMSGYTYTNEEKEGEE